MHASVALPAVQLKTKTTGTEFRLETFQQLTNLLICQLPLVHGVALLWTRIGDVINTRKAAEMIVALHPLNYGDLGKDL